MLEIYWTLCLKSLNFSFYLLLFPFANYYQGLDVGLLQWFSFKILRGKLAHGRPEFTPLRMLERLTAVKGVKGARGWVAGIASHGSGTRSRGWLVSSGSPWTSQAPNLHIAMQFVNDFYLYQVGCMTRSPVEFKDTTMIGGILQILNIHYGSPIDEYVLLWCMMVSSPSGVM